MTGGEVERWQRRGKRMALRLHQRRVLLNPRWVHGWAIDVREGGNKELVVQHGGLLTRTGKWRLAGRDRQWRGGWIGQGGKIKSTYPGFEPSVFTKDGKN